MPPVKNLLIHKKRSIVWAHFTPISTTLAKCNHCNKTKSYTGGSTGNLLRHMNAIHTAIPLHRSTQVNNL